jgi:hypothetical protein
MVKALTDPNDYWEPSLEGEMICVVHIYYGCPNERCNTIARLRFRKDGLPGDLARMIEIRKAAGIPLLEEMPGDMEKMLDI